MKRRSFFKSLGIASIMPMVSIKPANDKLYTECEIMYIAGKIRNDGVTLITGMVGSSIAMTVYDSSLSPYSDIYLENGRKFQRVESIKDKVLFKEI